MHVHTYASARVCGLLPREGRRARLARRFLGTSEGVHGVVPERSLGSFQVAGRVRCATFATQRRCAPVSYTHLTLPTILLV
eukprot:6942510-Pyramimonas_sp.AAC.1